MKILVVLTYYRPHISGLTIYAERLARGLAARGHAVTVMTSRYDPTCPRDEVRDGVRVIRVPVLFRVSKGVVMPSFGQMATRLVYENEVVSLHLPQFDAAGVALRGRLMRRPTTLTYQCDLSMPPGLFHRLAGRAIDVANRLAARWAHRIVASSQDFAERSPLLRRHAGNVEVISPPIEMPPASEAAIAAFRARHALDGSGPVIGMAARLATEKGVEVLLDALPKVLAKYPGARVLFAGQHENVFGEEPYAQRLAPAFAEHRGRWTFLGIVDSETMAAFFSSLDVIVVPSLNSTEAFGMVQVEAMLCGTPSIASDLPGVRQPVRETGMGEIVPVGDADALANAIVRVVAERARYVRSRDEIARRYSTERTVDAYEQLFTRLVAEVRPQP